MSINLTSLGVFTKSNDGSNSRNADFGLETVREICFVDDRPVTLNQTTVKARVVVRGNIKASYANIEGSTTTNGSVDIKATRCTRLHANGPISISEKSQATEIESDGDSIAVNDSKVLGDVTAEIKVTGKNSEMGKVMAKKEISITSCTVQSVSCESDAASVELRKTIVVGNVDAGKQVSIKDQTEIKGKLTCTSEHLLIENSTVDTIIIKSPVVENEFFLNQYRKQLNVSGVRGYVHQGAQVVIDAVNDFVIDDGQTIPKRFVELRNSKVRHIIFKGCKGNVNCLGNSSVSFVEGGELSKVEEAEFKENLSLADADIVRGLPSIGKTIIKNKSVIQGQTIHFSEGVFQKNGSDLFIEAKTIEEKISCDGKVTGINSIFNGIESRNEVNLTDCKAKDVKVIYGGVKAKDTEFGSIESREEVELTGGKTKDVKVIYGGVKAIGTEFGNIDAREQISLTNLSAQNVRSKYNQVIAKKCILTSVSSNQTADLEDSVVNHSLELDVDSSKPCKLRLKGSRIKGDIIVTSSNRTNEVVVRQTTSLFQERNYSSFEEIPHSDKSFALMICKDGTNVLLGNIKCVVENRKLVPNREEETGPFPSITLEISGGEIDGRVTFKNCQGNVMFVDGAKITEN